MLNLSIAFVKHPKIHRLFDTFQMEVFRKFKKINKAVSRQDVIWSTPLFNLEVKTLVGKTFLALLKRFCPK